MIIKIFIPIPDLVSPIRLYEELDRSFGEVSYRRVFNMVIVGCWIMILAFLVMVAYYAAVEPNIGGAI